MTAQVFVLPTPIAEPDDIAAATPGALATWGTNLYVRDVVGWICLGGNHWTRHLDHEAVLIREGL